MAEATAYCERADVEAVFGTTNVQKWADLDSEGDEEAIAARIARGIAWATARLNNRLRKSIYALPLANAEGAVDPEVSDIVANLAGVWLYENRGVQDVDPDSGQAVHRLEWNRRRAEQTIRELLAGTRTLDAEMVATSFAPQAISHVDADGSGVEDANE